MPNKRDWDADWAMCEAATPEPWHARLTWREDGKEVYEIMCKDETRIAYDWACLYPFGGINVDIWPNANFVAEARSALPYWLLRVKELETENARKANTERLLNAEIAAHHREIARLRAVVEAAEKLYLLHEGDLETEVDDLQKSQEHMDAEEALFDALDAYHAAKEDKTP